MFCLDQEDAALTGLKAPKKQQEEIKKEKILVKENLTRGVDRRRLT